MCTFELLKRLTVSQTKKIYLQKEKWSENLRFHGINDFRY